MTERGFRKFMLDPKSSVMTYIADNIPAEHLSHQQGSSNGRLQQHGQQPNIHDPNGVQQNQIPGQNPQSLSQESLVRPYLPHRPSQSNSQASSPRPGYAQPVPYIASNLVQANPGSNGYPGAQNQLPSSQSVSSFSTVHDSMSQNDPQNHGGQTTAALGQGPPQPGARRRNSPQSAPSLYHRMILEFEVMKQAFFVAKSRKSASLRYDRLGVLNLTILEHNVQEMTSIAYDLESSSRRIWGLRYEHAWEFEGYSEVGQQAVFFKWQAEYEMWADTVLDMQDGQILTDAANPTKYGNASTHKDSDEWNSQSRQDQFGYQSLHGDIEHQNQSVHQEQMPPGLPQQMYPQQQMPPQQQISPPQQMPQLQNLSMSQSVPPSQSFQGSQTSQPMPPGAFPQSGPLGPTSDQSMPLQQRQQSPHPPQMQNPAPDMQNGQYMQPGQFTGLQNMQNAPNSPPSKMQQPPNIQDPNMQQPPNMKPGQGPSMQQGQNRPPQQYMQQNQGNPLGSAPYPPQPQTSGAGQQRPPRNGPPSGQTMPQRQNMGARQNPAPQAGGQGQGNGNGRQ